MKKLFCMLFAIVMLIGNLSVDSVHADIPDILPQKTGFDSVNCKVPISVTYDYNSAFQVLSIINKERQKENLPALIMDKELLDAAMVRAAETSLFVSHNRPNGLLCFSLSSKMFGENIAAGQASSVNVMNTWMNSSGHRANILSSAYSSVGVGAVKVGEKRYWVQCFGGASIVQVDGRQYANKTMLTEVDINLSGASGDDTGMFRAVADGDKEVILNSTGRVYLCINNTYAWTEIHSQSVIFESSNPTVCTVSDVGIIKGIKAGTAKITMSLKDCPRLTADMTVTVTDPYQPPTVNAKLFGKGVVINFDSQYPVNYIYYKEGTGGWKRLGTSYYYENTYKDYGIAPGKTRSYRVRSGVTEGKYTRYSKIVTIKYVAAPTLKAAKSLGSRKIKVEWKASKGAEAYVIYRKGGSDKSWKKVADVSKSKTSYTDSKGVVKGKTYTYTVRAVSKVDSKRVYSAYNSKGVKCKTK